MCKPSALWLVATLAAGMLLPAAGIGVAAAQASSTDSEGGEEDSEQRRGPLPPEEPPAAATSSRGLGVIRRADPFGRAHTTPPPSSTGGPKGVVICEAGCDGPRGKVVYGR